MAFHVGSEEIVVESRDFDKKGDRENEKVSYVSLHVAPTSELTSSDMGPTLDAHTTFPSNVSQTALE